MAKIDPKGVVSIFQISLNSKKSKISNRGGGSSLFWKNSKMFPFFNYDASPKLKKISKFSEANKKCDNSANFEKFGNFFKHFTSNPL